VGIARAIARNSRIILADEPTASLDAESGRQILELLAKLSRSADRFVVVVSHDTRLNKYARRLITLQDGKVLLDERFEETSA
jgi:putative ABC transport system ATP-binding protein